MKCNKYIDLIFPCLDIEYIKKYMCYKKMHPHRIVVKLKLLNDIE